MDNKQLCSLCLGLNVDSLTAPEGYHHAKTQKDLQASAESCPMCKLMNDSLGSKLMNGTKGVNKDAESYAQAPILCRLYQPQESLVILKITAGPTKTGFIDTYTREGDHASKFGVLQRIDPASESSSKHTLPLAWHFMEMCLKEHGCGNPFRRPDDSQLNSQEECHQKADSKKQPVLDALPSRLIYLNAFGTDCLDAELLDISANTKADYASLSYCWGPSSKPMYKTTSENLDSRKERIVWSELPKTFQDAFHIARRLAIPLLWIDAICIVQDSKADWELESAKMGAIYASSVITISADVSDSVDGGILDLVDKTAGGTYTGHMEVSATLKSGHTSTLFFYLEESSVPGKAFTPQCIVDGPLSSRAWCMQERMLSSRILHFTKKGLVCECREKYYSPHMLSSFDYDAMTRTLPGALRMFEEGLPGFGWGLKVGAVQDSQLTEDELMFTHSMIGFGHASNLRITGGGETNNKKGDQNDLVSWWYKNIVTEYSARRLTFQTDRMVALSGMATVFGAYIGSQYIAGLWLAEIEEGLEWKRAGATYQDKKLEIYPSFSWMSHPGPVKWPYVWHMRPWGKAFQVSGPDPYRSITSAYLVLQGKFRAAILDSIKPTTEDTFKPHLVDDEGNNIGEVELDFDDVLNDVYCFLLYRNSFNFLRLLLIQRVEERSLEYRRVGVGIVYPKNREWLEGEKSQTIRLI